jgi:hypothetical protein
VGSKAMPKNVWSNVFMDFFGYGCFTNRFLHRGRIDVIMTNYSDREVLGFGFIIIDIIAYRDIYLDKLQ